MRGCKRFYTGGILILSKQNTSHCCNVMITRMNVSCQFHRYTTPTWSWIIGSLWASNSTLTFFLTKNTFHINATYDHFFKFKKQGDTKKLKLPPKENEIAYLSRHNKEIKPATYKKQMYKKLSHGFFSSIILKNKFPPL